MKKIFITIMMVAAMAAMSSCACSNNSDKSTKCSTEQCAGCDKKDSCGEAEGCQSDATKCSEEKCAGCDKKDSCDKSGCSEEKCAACDKKESCDKKAEHKCKGCDSTAVKDSCCKRN